MTTTMADNIFCVPDTMRDERFCQSAFVTKPPHVQFYCGTRAEVISRPDFDHNMTDQATTSQACVCAPDILPPKHCRRLDSIDKDENQDQSHCPFER